MLRFPTSLALALGAAFSAAAIGQDGDPAALARAADETALEGLHAQADALAEQRQHGRAVHLRRAIVQEFAPGDEKALAALGFVRVGEVWRRDDGKLVIEKDLTGDAKILKKLDQDWTRTQRDLARRYERAAEALEAAGRADEALVCWRRLLFFKPGDRKATAAMHQSTFEGVAGSVEELRVLRKGRAIVQSVDFLKRLPVRVERLEDRQHPLLQKAGVPHHGVASHHFEIFGTLPIDQLELAAQWAERSLLLCRTLFGTSGGEAFRPVRVLPMLWVGDRDTYKRVLAASADQFRGEPDRLRFLQEDVELAFLTDGDRLVRLYMLERGEEELLDQTVRGVAQDATKFESHGLWEGIGHAICGLFFDRTLTFFLEQQNANTVSTWQPRPLVPDMAIWREIAAESAWAQNDTPIARLVLLHGARFSNEERVKAWATADWLVHARPEWLLWLDACKTDEVRDATAVEDAFRQKTGVELSSLDRQWRDYWGKVQALREAMRAAPRGSDDAVRGARELADAIDGVRCAAARGPVGFYVAESQATVETHAWYAALARAEKEQKKNPQLPLPEPPASACAVLSHRGTDAGAAVAAWMRHPALRDVLLHPGRILFGCSKGKLAWVLDPIEPAPPTASGLPLTWPVDGQRDVAPAALVQDLGPALAEGLRAAGRGPRDEIGMPLSLHFGRRLDGAAIADVGCRVLAGGRELAGETFCVQDEGLGGAPGCFCFVPREPLPRNAEIEVRWTMPRGLLQRGETFPPVRFRVL